MEEALSPFGRIEVEEAFGPSPYAPTAGNPPAWSSQPPSVGIGAASQDTSSRGTNGAIRKSRTSGQDPSRNGYDAARSKCVAVRAIPPGHRQPSRADVLGTAKVVRPNAFALDFVSSASVRPTRQPQSTVLAGYFHGANYPKDNLARTCWLVLARYFQGANYPEDNLTRTSQRRLLPIL